jgi:DNA-binding response OmpR family regulator
MTATRFPQILIVDDEADMCWALASTLRREGYTVTTALQGRLALDLCACQHYALAFVDAKLPDLDGLELIALLRQKTPSTRIVLVSGFLDQEDVSVVDGLRQGRFDGFLAKPVDLREVRQVAHLFCAASPTS